ncbi:DNA-directed RNA polymerase subunit beta [Streptococcus cameli]
MNKENLQYVGRQFLLVLAIILLAFIVFVLGLMVGYAVVGDGEKATAILSLTKWQELISKFTGK